MKTLLILLTLLSITSAFAEQKSTWTCYLDDEVALQISDYSMTISSDEVCNALNIKCPFVSHPSATSPELGKLYYPTFKGKYIWGAVKGKYEDGVIFYSEDTGMKVSSLYTGSSSSVNWDKNWYFEEDQCI